MRSQIKGQLSLFDTERKIPMMPEEYKGKPRKKDNYRLTIPVTWTPKQDEWLWDMRSDGYTKKEIAISMGRSVASISCRINRLRKLYNTYNDDHADEKYDINDKFLKITNPNSALDLYCGIKNFYKDKIKNSISNDIDNKINADYNMSAYECISNLYYQNQKYDLIDLDPFGSAYECIDMAIKMAEKGLIVTIGDVLLKRWKKERFYKIMKYYGLSDRELTIKNIAKCIQMIGEKNNKKLVQVYFPIWKNIGRIYFKIEKCK